MDAGWTITYNWTADADLYFDLHSHQGMDVNYHVQEPSVNASEGNFTAPERTTYSLFWERRADGPAALDWRMEGRFLGPHEPFPEDGGEATPGFVVAAAVAGLVLAAVLGRR